MSFRRTAILFSFAPRTQVTSKRNLCLARPCSFGSGFAAVKKVFVVFVFSVWLISIFQSRSARLTCGSCGTVRKRVENLQFVCRHSGVSSPVSFRKPNPSKNITHLFSSHSETARLKPSLLQHRQHVDLSLKSSKGA